MKFGIIPAYGAAPVETGAYVTGLARMAEALGFESVWPVEHVVMPASYDSIYPYDASGRMPIEQAAVPDPLIWLTWLAASSEHLRLGTSVLILPQRNPVVLAKIVASLDQLSGGRVELGVGLGWLREESDAVGVRFENRGARTDEYIRALRALWSEPVASFSGEHVSFREVRCNPLPRQRPGVPIHIGGHSRAAARRAGRLGDGFLPMGAGPAEIGRLCEVMRDEARSAGRDPASIEITCVGTPQLEVAQAYADLGVSRMVVAALEPDLEATRAVMQPFSEQVIVKLG